MPNCLLKMKSERLHSCSFTGVYGFPYIFEFLSFFIIIRVSISQRHLQNNHTFVFLGKILVCFCFKPHFDENCNCFELLKSAMNNFGQVMAQMGFWFLSIVFTSSTIYSVYLSIQFLTHTPIIFSSNQRRIWNIKVGIQIKEKILLSYKTIKINKLLYSLIVDHSWLKNIKKGNSITPKEKILSNKSKNSMMTSSMFLWISLNAISTPLRMMWRRHSLSSTSSKLRTTTQALSRSFSTWGSMPSISSGLASTRKSSTGDSLSKWVDNIRRLLKIGLAWVTFPKSLPTLGRMTTKGRRVPTPGKLKKLKVQIQKTHRKRLRKKLRLLRTMSKRWSQPKLPKRRE